MCVSDRADTYLSTDNDAIVNTHVDSSSFLDFFAVVVHITIPTHLDTGDRFVRAIIYSPVG